jgi:hypothetical protein
MAVPSKSAFRAVPEVRRTARRGGFTLIEGVVVITFVAVVGGLLANLLPGFGLPPETTNQLIQDTKARTREAVALFLEQNPKLIPFAREGYKTFLPAVQDFVAEAETLGDLFESPVTGDILADIAEPLRQFVDADDLYATTIPLNWSPVDLFSYNAVREQVGYYSLNPGVTRACVSLLDAAERAENLGNSVARAGHLRGLENLVGAQTGPGLAFTPLQGNVLFILIGML